MISNSKNQVQVEILGLLREVVAEVRGLRADLRERRSTSTLSRADRSHLGKLLPAIGGAHGSEPFAVRELFEHDSPALHVALRGVNAKQVGRLFRRAEGQPIDGLLVQQVGEELNVCLWRVAQVPGFPMPRNLTVPPRDPDDRR